MSIIRYYSSLFNGEAFRYPDQYIGAIFILCVITTLVTYGIMVKIFKKMHILSFLYFVLKSVLLGKIPRWSAYKDYRYMLAIRENEIMLKHDFRMAAVMERERELQEIEKIINLINSPVEGIR